ncbi:MAG TPA: protein kinase [Bryobacteraceae bacterium]|jgi:tetratricopeptide (TPR) repeat protein/predicted Ser/Thr protein kinase
MTPEVRFQRIEELYHAIREASGESERDALLAQTDPELRREVESLLAIRSGGEFLERPAVQNAQELLGGDASVTALVAGMILGPYRIESQLGAGGMGDVFRAVDTRLGRTVAIKTAHEQFSDRFEREARAISTLNHPNICTLYDVGPNYLVMELVEGETLAARLKQGPLPLETVLLFGNQIAAALTEAHSKGIIHRDLKPGNIMIGKTGIKILDFGIAKSSQDEVATAGHMIMGTPAYMAPEQRAGKAADPRVDIYAFGGVLYEMLTGARGGPHGKRIQPRSLERIVVRCLEEDPARRWQSAAELQRELASVRPGGRGIAYVAAGIAALLAVVSTAGYFYFRAPPKLTVRDTVVLADFENNTKDPVFDQTLRQGLTVQLEQSPFLTLVTDQQIQQELRLMKQPPETKLNAQVSHEICERTGSAAILEGSIATLGNQYVLWLRARNCRSGDVLAEEQAQTERKEDVLKTLSGIAIQMRTRLGESLASIQEHSTPLEEATTTSLEALKAYSAAKIAIYAHGPATSIPHLRQAIALDPDFAMAHADLGFMSYSLGQTDLAAEEVRIAYRLRDRVSDREKRYIVMLYDREVTGNLQKELQTLESWAQMYPRDFYAPGIISGWVTFGTGQYERGIQSSKHSMELAPEIPFPYVGVASHNLSLDRFREAAEALQLAADRKLEIPELLILRFHLAFLNGDQAGMDREAARGPEEHAEDWMTHNQALVLARAGRMRQARTMWERAIAMAQQAGKPETAPIYLAAEAVCEAHAGNLGAAKERARAALKLGKGRDVEYAAAFALARAGELLESQRLASDIDKRFPEDTPVQFEYLPTLNALLALSHQSPSDAIERLQRAVPYDFAMAGTAFFGKFGGLYTVFIRGEAYLAAGRGQEAVAEFQKVLSHRGVVLADPIGALAHLQLGRAYVVLGDKARAGKSYQDFFALWKDADGEVPILKQARAEFARL